MAEPQGSAVYPDVVTMTITNRKSGESRDFTQSELAIDGEAQLLGLVGWLGEQLKGEDFPWDTVVKLFDENTQSEFDWEKAMPILSILSHVAADVVVDSTCIMFGIFQFDEDRKPNPDWADTRKFLHGAMRFSQWVQVLQVFAYQNDYQRLADPFVRALGVSASWSSLRSGGPESADQKPPSPPPSTPSPAPATGRRRTSSATGASAE